MVDNLTTQKFYLIMSARKWKELKRLLVCALCLIQVRQKKLNTFIHPFEIKTANFHQCHLSRNFIFILLTGQAPINFLHFKIIVYVTMYIEIISKKNRFHFTERNQTCSIAFGVSLRVLMFLHRFHPINHIHCSRIWLVQSYFCVLPINVPFADTFATIWLKKRTA